MNKNDTTLIKNEKIVTIKSINFSKSHSKYTLTIQEEEGKIILDSDDYRCLIEGLGFYVGNWRGKKITVDEDYKVIKV